MRRRTGSRLFVGIITVASLYLYYQPSDSVSHLLFSGKHKHIFQSDDAEGVIGELREMVSYTKGYYVRDWSVGLGWNNLRYIIETSLLHSIILNRTLVLPTNVYARSCEYQEDVCSSFGLLVDRTEAIGWDTWSGAAVNPVAWQIPIELMLDLAELRKWHPVILTRDFYDLHRLSREFESLAGDWNRGDLENATFPRIHVIPNQEYDPSEIVRVDTLPLASPVQHGYDARANRTLFAALDGRAFLSWDDAASSLREDGRILQTDHDIEHTINKGGYQVLHTFQGAAGMDFVKTVTNSLRQISHRSRLRGLQEDFGRIDAEVLLLEGETHLERKPGALRFTTPEARQRYTDLVLHALKPPQPMLHLAQVIAGRMSERCGGRMWMAAHMRRGDFVVVGWSMEADVQKHLARIRNKLAEGRDVLRRLVSELHPDDVEKLVPRVDDPIFIATDERSPEAIELMRNQSFILLQDILTVEDRKTFGWPIVFTDVVALVEQQVLAKADYFYGHALSSLTGGVINLRAASGRDTRTALVD